MTATPGRPSRAGAMPDALGRFACPNPDCALFNRFAAGNVRAVEGTGRGRAIRRLYCTACGRRFSERRGTLLAYTKLPLAVVVRVLKCLAHGCSVEAAADICEVQPQTVERLLEAAGRRAADFHRLHLERLPRPPEVVQLDELHARVAEGAQKGGAARPAGPPGRGAGRDADGCQRHLP